MSEWPGFAPSNREAALESENQRLRDELRSEMMERSDAEREADRLRAECDALRHEVCQRIAERAGETFRKRALHDRYVTLRDGIEKLRDDVERLHDLDDEDFDGGWVSQRYVARRITEMLEGDFQEQLDRARVKYRGALDELRDK